MSSARVTDSESAATPFHGPDQTDVNASPVVPLQHCILYYIHRIDIASQEIIRLYGIHIVTTIFIKNCKYLVLIIFLNILNVQGHDDSFIHSLFVNIGYDSSTR